MIEDKTTVDAAEWLARLRRPQASNDDKAEFAAWLAESPSHKFEFDQMLGIWETLGRSLAQIDVREHKRPVAPYAFAAGFLLAIAAAVLLQLGGVAYETDVGVIAHVALNDGSKIHLNTKSAVDVQFSTEERRLLLHRGEVFVTVAPDPSRPFVVATRHGSTRAVGTAFGVKVSETATEINVLEGTVVVDGKRGLLHASADEQVRLTADSQMQTSIDAESVNAWKDGLLIYDGVRLQTLIDDLNRYYPRRMTLGDETLRNVRVSATLTLEDQSSVLDALSQSISLRWAQVADNLIIIRPNT